LFQNSVINIIGNATLLKEMGKKSRETVERRFSFDRVVEQYEQLYRTLMNN
jgi:glycosyltransferase involved in cell wall biosynthesis